MKRVIGLGGVFFKVKDVAKIKEWYRDHLGFVTTDWGATFVVGNIDPAVKTLSRTEWSPFKEDTDYFEPGKEPFMINYRVHNLRKLVEALREEGVTVAGEMQEFEYGKFCWILDNENRKIELYEPVEDAFGDSPAVWTQRVTGIGGVFFKSDDPKKSKEWYSKHLGVSDLFLWKDLGDPDAKGPAQTVWCPFKSDTDYFNPSTKPFMFNYRVKDIKSLVKSLADEGVTIAGDIQEYPYGKFGWIMDPEGNKIELWEPVD